MGKIKKAVGNTVHAVRKRGPIAEGAAMGAITGGVGGGIMHGISRAVEGYSRGGKLGALRGGLIGTLQGAAVGATGGAAAGATGAAIGRASERDNRKKSMKVNCSVGQKGLITSAIKTAMALSGMKYVVDNMGDFVIVSVDPKAMTDAYRLLKAVVGDGNWEIQPLTGMSSTGKYTDFSSKAIGDKVARLGRVISTPMRKIGEGVGNLGNRIAARGHGVVGHSIQQIRQPGSTVTETAHVLHMGEPNRIYQAIGGGVRRAGENIQRHAGKLTAGALATGGVAAASVMGKKKKSVGSVVRGMGSDVGAALSIVGRAAGNVVSHTGQGLHNLGVQNAGTLIDRAGQAMARNPKKTAGALALAGGAAYGGHVAANKIRKRGEKSVGSQIGRAATFVGEHAGNAIARTGANVTRRAAPIAANAARGTLKRTGAALATGAGIATNAVGEAIAKHPKAAVATVGGIGAGLAVDSALNNQKGMKKRVKAQPPKVGDYVSGQHVYGGTTTGKVSFVHDKVQADTPGGGATAPFVSVGEGARAENFIAIDKIQRHHKVPSEQDLRGIKGKLEGVRQILKDAGRYGTMAAVGSAGAAAGGRAYYSAEDTARKIVSKKDKEKNLRGKVKANVPEDWAEIHEGEIAQNMGRVGAGGGRIENANATHLPHDLTNSDAEKRRRQQEFNQRPKVKKPAYKPSTIRGKGIQGKVKANVYDNPEDYHVADSHERLQNSGRAMPADTAGVRVENANVHDSYEPHESTNQAENARRQQQYTKRNVRTPKREPPSAGPGHKDMSIIGRMLPVAEDVASIAVRRMNSRNQRDKDLKGRAKANLPSFSGSDFREGRGVENGNIPSPHPLAEMHASEQDKLRRQMQGASRNTRSRKIQPPSAGPGHKSLVENKVKYLSIAANRQAKMIEKLTKSVNSLVTRV